MKKILLISLFVSVASHLSYGQDNLSLFMNPTTNGQTFTTCGALIYSSLVNPDSIWSQTAVRTVGYSPNEDYTITICSGTSEPVRAKLSISGFGPDINSNNISFAADSSVEGEHIEVFDGDNTGAPLLGNIRSFFASSIRSLTSTNPGNCITIRFRSDSTAVGRGFVIAAGCRPTECIPGSGIPAASDFCGDAPEICSIKGYCGNTSGWYTTLGDTIVEDGPGNLHFGQLSNGKWNNFHNSSWLKFVADATSASFEITSLNCANQNNGIQAMIYDADCATFTPKSNVVSQGGGPGLSILSATGLVVGQEYYFMVDGFNGNICDYSIAVTGGVDVITTKSNGGTSICPGDCIDVTLGSSRAVTSYIWSVSPASATSGLSTTGGGATDSVVTFCAPTAGTFTVTGTATGICGSNAVSEIVITAGNSATKAFTLPSNFCISAANPTPTITTAGGTFSISSGGVLLDPATGEVDISASGLGSHTLYYAIPSTGSSCAGEDSAQFTISNPPNDPVISDLDACLSAGNPTLTASSSGTISWFDVAGNLVNTGASYTPNITAAGQYIYLLLSEVTGCKSGTTNVTLTVNDFSVAIITNPLGNPIVTGAVPFLVDFSSNPSSGVTHLWNFGDGNTSTLAAPSNTYTTKGTYIAKLIASDASGCQGSDSVTIEITDTSVFTIPNVITPNGDDINDVFIVVGGNLKSMQGEIWNRWGQKLFTWNDIDGSWDGKTPSGDPAPEGTYFYIIKAEGDDKTIYDRKGTFSLLR